MPDAAVRERPILFSGEMVRALLAGRKTMTRRVVKPQPERGVVEVERTAVAGCSPPILSNLWAFHLIPVGQLRVTCPYGAPGDRLWIREALSVVSDGLEYAADGAMVWMDERAWDFWNGRAPEDGPDVVSRTIPSIHMPRWASRLTLEITDVRVERLQEISAEDAIAEGVHRSRSPSGLWIMLGDQEDGWGHPRDAFAYAWNTINGPCAFDANPWVWCVSFRPLGTRAPSLPVASPVCADERGDDPAAHRSRLRQSLPKPAAGWRCRPAALGAGRGREGGGERGPARSGPGPALGCPCRSRWGASPSAIGSGDGGGVAHV